MSPAIPNAWTTPGRRGPALVGALVCLAGGLVGQSPEVDLRAQVARSRVVNAIATKLFSYERPGEAKRARALLRRTADAAAEFSAEVRKQGLDLSAIAKELDEHYRLLVGHHDGQGLEIYYDWIEALDAFDEPRVVQDRILARARLLRDLNEERVGFQLEQLSGLSKTVAAVGEMGSVEDTEDARRALAQQVSPLLTKCFEEGFWGRGINQIQILSRFFAGVSPLSESESSLSLIEPLAEHIDTYFASPAGQSETLVSLYKLFGSLAEKAQLEERLQRCTNLVKIDVSVRGHAQGVDVSVQMLDNKAWKPLPSLRDTGLSSYYVPKFSHYRITVRTGDGTMEGYMEGYADIFSPKELRVALPSGRSSDLCFHLHVAPNGSVSRLLFPSTFWTNADLRQHLQGLQVRADAVTKDEIAKLIRGIWEDAADANDQPCLLTVEQTETLSGVLGEKEWRVPSDEILERMLKLLECLQGGQDVLTKKRIAHLRGTFTEPAPLLLYKEIE